jgi:hypothetical protein
MLTLNLTQLLLLGILCASIHWLIARAEITRGFWSRIDGLLGKLLACPACSGFWLGLGLGSLGVAPVEPHVFGRPDSFPFVAGQVLLTGILGVFVTPVFEAVLLWGLVVTRMDGDDPTKP